MVENRCQGLLNIFMLGLNMFYDIHSFNPRSNGVKPQEINIKRVKTCMTTFMKSSATCIKNIGAL